MHDDAAGQEVLQCPPPLVEQHRDEAEEERRDRDQRPREADQRTAEPQGPPVEPRHAVIPLRSLLGDMIVRAGGESIAGETPGVDPVPLSRILRLDPHVYLATSDSRVTLRTLRDDPRTRKLTAVEDGRVRVLPSDLVQRAGPNVAQALERVAKALHPDAFQNGG